MPAPLAASSNAGYSRAWEGIRPTWKSLPRTGHVARALTPVKWRAQCPLFPFTDKLNKGILGCRAFVFDIVCEAL